MTKKIGRNWFPRGQNKAYTIAKNNKKWIEFLITLSCYYNIKIENKKKFKQNKREISLKFFSHLDYK